MSRDEEIYGAELIADVKRWQQEGNKEVVSRVQELERQATQNKVELARQRCMDALDRDPELGDKWRKLNQDPKFIAWCNQVDDLFGRPRMAALHQAFDIGATDRCIAIFKGYLASLIPPRARTETRLPMEEPTAARRPSVSVADVDGRQKKIWTGQEIRQFYLDRSKGRYDGREHEAGRIEADIFRAQKENRIAANSVQSHMPGRRPWE